MHSTSVISRFKEASSFTGAFTRVAKRLGVSNTHVRAVALGERKSDRVMKELAAEVKRIDRAREREATVQTERAA